MLWTIILVLVILWALGLFTGLGGSFVHALLVLALLVLVLNLMRGRKAV